MTVLYFVRPSSFKSTRDPSTRFSTIYDAVSDFIKNIQEGQNSSERYFQGVPNLHGVLYADSPLGETFLSTIVVPNECSRQFQDLIGKAITPKPAETVDNKEHAKEHILVDEHVPGVAPVEHAAEKPDRTTHSMEIELADRIYKELSSVCKDLVAEHFNSCPDLMSPDDVIRKLKLEIVTHVKQNYSNPPVVDYVHLDFRNGKVYISFHFLYGNHDMTCTVCPE